MHIVVLDVKAKNVQILTHPLAGRGLGQRQYAALKGEPDTKLRYGYLVFLRKLLKQRLSKYSGPSDGAPGLHLNAQALAEIHRGLLHISRMELQLIHHRNDTGPLQQVVQMVRQEIADADGPHFFRLIEILQGFPGFHVQILPPGCQVVGSRPVNQIQIQIVGAQFFTGLFKLP